MINSHADRSGHGVRELADAEVVDERQRHAASLPESSAGLVDGSGSRGARIRLVSRRARGATAHLALTHGYALGDPLRYTDPTGSVQGPVPAAVA